MRRLWQLVSRWYLGISASLVGILVLAVEILLLSPRIAHRGFVSELNRQLGSVSNVMLYLSTVFAVLAFVIAVFAYGAAVKRPRLRVHFTPWVGERDHLELPVTQEGGVPKQRRLAEWHVQIENYGSATARFPVVQIEFHGMFFGEDHFHGWDKVLHAQAFGWYGIRWSPGSDVVVHPNFPLELPVLYFSGMQVGRWNTDKEPSLELTITVAADGCDPWRERRTVILRR